MSDRHDMPEIVIDRDHLDSFEAASAIEWIETDGLGGWASSTLSGAHTRRYHGLLVAATKPPVARVVLLAKLDETLAIGAHAPVALSSNAFPAAVHPAGWRQLARFTRGAFPVFEFEVEGARLVKTIAALDGEPTRVIVYTLQGASEPATLRLRPFLTCRDVHALGPAMPLDETVHSAKDTLCWRPCPDSPTVSLRADGARFEPGSDWYRHFHFAIERERGFDFAEDLFTPGELVVTLEPGRSVAVLASTSPVDGRDGHALLARERARREALVAELPPDEPLAPTLALAADQFIVRRGDDLRTIIAGYHWFADWGRDTMIALPGLCLATGRHDDARRILLTFARSLDQGMLPNRFPDDGERPEYNTVDATLWFFVAVHHFLACTGDETTVRDALLPALREAVHWHVAGTRHGIRVDEDGLLRAGEFGVQLTWMDAKVGDWVVTPRHGKPVEIQALWINALAILAALEARFGDVERAHEAGTLLGRARRAFVAQFWNDQAGCLYDVVTDAGPDASIRPNQILALALPYPVLPDSEARSVLRVVEERLLTPMGLRTLDPADANYRPRYEGGPFQRDGAYHQGTVWPWLLGPYATALVRLRGEAGRREARAALAALVPHLHEGCAGTIAEIADGDAPHRPKGAAAQAWSVAEILRALLWDVRGEQPGWPANDGGGS